MKAIAVGSMRPKAAGIGERTWGLVRLGLVPNQFRLRKYVAGRSLFAMSVGLGWGWGSGITRWAQTAGVPLHCAGLPAGPADRRAGITAVPSRSGDPSAPERVPP